MKEHLFQTLSSTVANLIPGALLQWRELPGTEGLRGLFLEEEAALRPLPASCTEAVMQAPPYWGLLWPSGERLCRLFRQSPELLSGRTVVDFGCGCGLVAIAATCSGAEQAWAVDRDPLALAASRLNALENRVCVEFVSEVPTEPFDLLVLADFLYDQTHLCLFAELESCAREVLVVDSRLKSLDYPGFSYLGEDRGEAVPDLDPHREFGILRFWYRGDRELEWMDALALPSVAQGVCEC